MTRDPEQRPADVDEHVERLICRCLDGEAGPEEQADLAGILVRDPSARALYETYRQLDGLAASALRRDLNDAETAVVGRRFRGLWLATAGAVLTAAAVIALSFLPGLWSPVVERVSRPSPVPEVAVEPAGRPFAGRQEALPVRPQWVDYRQTEEWPARRFQDVRRDLIGIRSSKNKNVIFILERGSQSTRIVPISGDI